MGGKKVLIRETAVVFAACLLLAAAAEVSVHRIFTRGLRRKLSQITEKEVKQARSFSESVVDRLDRLERALILAGVSGPPLPHAISALPVAKEGLIHSKTAIYLSDKFCSSVPRDNSKCLQELSHVLSECSPDLGRENCSANWDWKYRPIDGRCSPPNQPLWGLAHTPYSRIIPAAYDDGMWRARGSFRKLPDALEVADTVEAKKKDLHVTTAFAAWSHFIAADLAETIPSHMISNELALACCSSRGWQLSPRHRHDLCFPLVPNHTRCVSYARSMLAPTLTCSLRPAQQMNGATHWLDGSSIYNGLHHVKDTSSDDVSLETSIVQLLAKEHKRVEKALRLNNPSWSKNKVFLEARRIVVAEIQHITYSEWLPIVLGPKLIKKTPSVQIPSSGYAYLYKERRDPSVFNSFANAAMNVITSMFGDKKRPVNQDHEEREMVKGEFKDWDSFIRGLASEVETVPYSGVTMGLDIQRGRDHGLPPFTEYRRLFGLSHESFDAIADTVPKNMLSMLKKAYKKVSEIDLVVGGAVEKEEDGSLVGPTLAQIVLQQMERTRMADSYFYDNKNQLVPFTHAQLNEIRKSSIARLLCDNALSVGRMQPKAFFKSDTQRNQLVSCADESAIPKVNLKVWKET